MENFPVWVVRLFLVFGGTAFTLHTHTRSVCELVRRGIHGTIVAKIITFLCLPFLFFGQVWLREGKRSPFVYPRISWLHKTTFLPHNKTFRSENAGFNICFFPFPYPRHGSGFDTEWRENKTGISTKTNFEKLIPALWSPIFPLLAPFLTPSAPPRQARLFQLSNFESSGPASTWLALKTRFSKLLLRPVSRFHPFEKCSAGEMNDSFWNVL